MKQGAFRSLVVYMNGYKKARTFGICFSGFLYYFRKQNIHIYIL